MTGILFDLDGTLLDTLQDLTDASNAILRQFGYAQRTKAEIRSFVGNGAARQVRLMLPEGVDPEQPLAAYKTYYSAHCQIHTAPYPGILEALSDLGKRYPIAIVSNKPDTAVKLLCADYFPGIYALGERPDCPRKPAPDMVHRAMEAIGADRCIYVGDSEVDVLTAKNAGVPSLTVLWGFRDREPLAQAGAHRFCQTPAELPAVIDRMAEEISNGQ